MAKGLKKAAKRAKAAETAKEKGPRYRVVDLAGRSIYLPREGLEKEEALRLSNSLVIPSTVVEITPP